MRYADLVKQLLDQTPFDGNGEAQAALKVSLQTLRLLVPRRLAEQLATALPLECYDFLTPPPAPDEQDGLVTREASELGALRGPLLERVQMTCAALGPLLPPELVARLEHELPPRLAQAFRQRACILSATLAK